MQEKPSDRKVEYIVYFFDFIGSYIVITLAMVSLIVVTCRACTKFFVILIFIRYTHDHGVHCWHSENAILLSASYHMVSSTTHCV